MNFGKNFVDVFSNNLQQDRNKQVNPIQPLSTKTGINKKKSTALQQQIVGGLSSNGFVQ